ncbi:hypothetical protein [Nitrospirillum viridazoti]|uniref:Uncharacterized protein n=1 Tax=Nitrospirillum amazonense TaxID=28077 RepID=A0A560IDF5_9PROT|nr:hypothetical protein [Nitrospirillum amazonense]TWB56121.1 hypothetical protein FBZ92_113115 [Nitrospirillum amazonense]
MAPLMSLLVTASEPDQVSLLVADLIYLYGTRIQVTERFTDLTDGDAVTHCASLEIRRPEATHAP